jgi:hypothetical protein
MNRNSQTAERQRLRARLDGMRQMLLLAVGTGHRVYRTMDAAYLSGNIERMRLALEEFDRLPEEEKQYALGLDHNQDELTGTD